MHSIGLTKVSVCKGKIKKRVSFALALSTKKRAFILDLIDNNPLQALSYGSLSKILN